MDWKRRCAKSWHGQRRTLNTTGLQGEQAVSVLNALASDPELPGDFILESREYLSSIEMQLLTIEQDPSHGEAIHSIFRGFHTIKGLAGFLEIGPVQQVAHEVETVLDLARNGALSLTPPVVDLILESKD
jgi:two-component system, chemotaxis family, sensor kinase CheA